MEGKYAPVKSKGTRRVQTFHDEVCEEHGQDVNEHLFHRFVGLSSGLNLH